MRVRLIILLVAILLVAGFAALNWSEFMRSTPLSFGVLIMDAPLGLILLGLLTLTLVAFLISSAYQQTRHLVDSRHHAKALEAQRELADRAEASRFTDLRQHLDARMRELQEQRGSHEPTEFEKNMVQSQRELRTQLELMNRTLATRLGDIEGRLAGRSDEPRVRASDSTPILG